MTKTLACAAFSLFASFACSFSAYAFQEVDASTFGFDEEDATAALQAAIDSGADRVIVPNMGSDWFVEPIQLRSNQEIVFQPGVVVTAKPGSFQGVADMLFTARDVENLILSGYGATLRMQKEDYQNAPYAPGEWRHVLALLGCTNVLVEGLTLRESGGDGLYIGSGNWSRAGYPSYSGNQTYCKNIIVRDVVADGNHRQGISVISAESLLIENVTLANTSGTAPQAGIDLEPNGADGRLVDIVLRNVVAENNWGPAFFIYVSKLDHTSLPVSIRFENCVARNGNGEAFSFHGPGGNNPPTGLVEVINFRGENMGGPAINIREQPANGIQIRFIDCTFVNVSRGEAFHQRYPVWIQMRESESLNQGGIEFVNFVLHDDRDRNFLVVQNQGNIQVKLEDVLGDLTVYNPFGARVQMSPETLNVNLEIIEIRFGVRYATGFRAGNNPGYTPGVSLIGVDGWEMGILDSGNPDDARVGMLPGTEESPVARLSTAAAVDSGSNAQFRRTEVVRQIGPIDASVVEVRFDLAVDWTGESTAWMGVQINPAGSTPVTVGFSTDGYAGLHFEHGGDKTSILAPGEVRKLSFYHVQLLLYPGNNTFSISVTGTDGAGERFNFFAGNLTFLETAAQVIDVRLTNGDGDLLTLYVDNLVVSPGRLGFQSSPVKADEYAAVRLVIPTFPDLDYQILTSENLVDWTEFAASFAGVNAVLKRYLSIRDREREFYRLTISRK